MPIYYKKVDHDANDLNLIESGLGSSNGCSSSSFFNGLGSVPKKLSSPFAGSRCSVNEVELEKIRYSFDRVNGNYADGGSHDGEEFDKSRLLSKTNDGDRDRLMTKFGPVVVVKQIPATAASAGAPRPVIITYHDVGLNYFSNFESFFSRANIKQMLQDFRIYHVNAPGQEENADDLSSNYLFPTMDELAQQLAEICRYYGIQEFIGFGYGTGSNVLGRFALKHADMVEALFLVNPSATTSTWSEWFYQKLNLRALAVPSTTTSAAPGTASSSSLAPSADLPPSVQDYFLWNLFGNLNHPDRTLDTEAVTFYRRYFGSGVINSHNLARFIESYVNRTALGISRDDPNNNFDCPVAVVCGDYSPHVDESVKTNSRLDPSNSTWVKLSECAMPLEEQPGKMAEVLRLFLQGLGYTLKKSARGGGLHSTNGTGKSMPCLQFRAAGGTDLSPSHSIASPPYATSSSSPSSAAATIQPNHAPFPMPSSSSVADQVV